MVDTLEEARERIRLAMKPVMPGQGKGFSPGVQGIRQTANKRRPPARQTGGKLPTAR